MRTALARLDFVIRIAAVTSLGAIGMPMAGLLCLFIFISQGEHTTLIAVAILVGAGSISMGIAYLALVPERVESKLPGPPVFRKMLVRIPTYPCGIVGPLAFAEQVWNVAIPDLLRRATLPPS